MKDKAMEVPAIAAIIEKWKLRWLGMDVSWFVQVVQNPLLRVMAEAPTDDEVKLLR